MRWESGNWLAALALLALSASMPGAQAQSYPVKSVRVIVPQSSGSAADMLLRVVGPRISLMFGQPLLVDNRPGAGGVTATEMAARAAPDGYTLFIGSISTHAAVPALYRKLPFDPIKDFAPISLWVIIPNVLAVHPSLPVRTTRDLIALARAKPGQLNVGSQGNGSSQHLATELFKIMAGHLNAVHVPYKGSGPAMVALISGEIAFLLPTLALATPHIRAGRIRVIAVATPQRIEELPQLPTIGDTVPGFEMQSWIGLLAPAGTPTAVIAQLNAASAKALAIPEVKQTLALSGMHTAQGSPEQFASLIEKELAKWTRVAREAKIEAD